MQPIQHYLTVLSGHSSSSFKLQAFIKSLGWRHVDAWESTPDALFQQPTPPLPILNIPTQLDLAAVNPELLQKTRSVVALLEAVFFEGIYTNTLYEVVEEYSEAITEFTHGQEFATLLLHAGAPMQTVLSGLLHDIARFCEPPEKANHDHDVVGDQILSALFGAEIGDFSFFHAYAKFLLFERCPPYRDILSDVSRHTLAIQKKDFTAQFSRLDSLFPGQPTAQESFMRQMMLLRLYDDASKVPVSAHFHLLSREDMRKMIYCQAMTHLLTIKPSAVSTQLARLDDVESLLSGGLNHKPKSRATLWQKQADDRMQPCHVSRPKAKL